MTSIRSLGFALSLAMHIFAIKRQVVWLMGLFLMMAVLVADNAAGAEAAADAGSDSNDLLLNLFIEKGYVSQQEAEKVKAEAEKRKAELEQYKTEAQTLKTETEELKAEVATLRAHADYDYNGTNYMPELSKPKTNIFDRMIVFGDVRLRYEDRSYTDPTGGSIDLNRFRYSIRVGLRGDVFEDFYYGLRIETSANPRSSWVTMGTSSSGNPYQGPFGKSTAGIGIGQVYIGWQPENWFEATLGKMPNPLYTTPMVWSPAINPEGAAEHLKYTVGDVDFFATFGQFLYADQNPASASGGLGFNGLSGQTANNIFQIAWQGGFNYHITTNISFKAAATIYQYLGLKRSSATGGGVAPYYGDPYVGEGAYTGPGSANPINGYSGYGTSGTLPGYQSSGYPNNQVGLNNLSVLELPFEFNFKLKKMDAKIFGDVAYNFEGDQRAQAAATAYAAYLNNQLQPATIKPFAPQTDDNKAYQIGFAIGSQDALGMVNGSVVKKNAWEARTYWQHVEQYALDPNLPDTDFFAGAQNMQGIYAAIAYGFSDNLIGTVRYGYASRINKLLGTGGTGQDIPQINPINQFQLIQVDLTFKF